MNAGDKLNSYTAEGSNVPRFNERSQQQEHHMQQTEEDSARFRRRRGQDAKDSVQSLLSWSTAAGRGTFSTTAVADDDITHTQRIINRRRQGF